MEQLPPSHRALQLSHEEILLITEALNNRYLSALKFIDDNKQFLSDNARSEILEKANKEDELRESIEAGLKDV